MTRSTLVTLLLVIASTVRADDPTLREQAATGLKKAATYYREKVASHGGYVYFVSDDLKKRWGEGAADADTLFVQPPGTPTVGLAYLKAHAATADRYYLDAAKETADTLVYGQLQSGGWAQTIHFGPAKRLGKYRNGKGGSWNTSSLDDGQTQAALTMLIRTDAALGFKDAAVHEAAEYGLKALLAAQYANGGFPQVWTKPVDKRAVKKATFPTGDWKTEGKVKTYWEHYTLNDDLVVSVSAVLIEAHRTYKDDKYKAALTKLGDFLVLAQMPDPQPAWCQQYDADMVPAWARKFEPPAITGWESQGAMETLIAIATYTGEKKYLGPIPAALKYLRRRVLSDGRLARFYEFGTDKPLYMDAAYKLTYDDSSAPTHYGWKQPSRLDQIEKAYLAAKDGKATTTARKPAEVEEQVRRILKELDADGRWMSTYAGERLVGQPKFDTGFRYLSSEVFARNVETLSDYLTATKK